jgi:hypothetical protein
MSTTINVPRLQTVIAVILLLSSLFIPQSALADFQVGENLKKRTDAILGLMSFSLTPDVTTGSLSLSNDPTGSPNVKMVTLGGGFTMSQELPLYLEGTLGYSRYDPTFLASDGQTERSVPTKWNSLSLTSGVGWDFPIANELKFRPIFNFSLGRVASDSFVAGTILENQTGEEFEFLKQGTLDVYGLGGTLMLDYERYREENEIDIELRYTNIRLQSYSDAPAVVQGSSHSESLSLWTRWRAPTNFTAMKRPVRYVIEVAHTSYLGDMRGALGFDTLNSVGAGLELDSSAYNVIVARTRVLLRYQFGDNVQGTSVGLAISF